MTYDFGVPDLITTSLYIDSIKPSLSIARIHEKCPKRLFAQQPFSLFNLFPYLHHL